MIFFLLEKEGRGGGRDVDHGGSDQIQVTTPRYCMFGSVVGSKLTFQLGFLPHVLMCY